MLRALADVRHVRRALHADRSGVVRWIIPSTARTDGMKPMVCERRIAIVRARDVIAITHAPAQHVGIGVLATIELSCLTAMIAGAVVWRRVAVRKQQVVVGVAIHLAAGVLP